MWFMWFTYKEFIMNISYGIFQWPTVLASALYLTISLVNFVLQGVIWHYPQHCSYHGEGIKRNPFLSSVTRLNDCQSMAKRRKGKKYPRCTLNVHRHTPGQIKFRKPSSLTYLVGGLKWVGANHYFIIYPRGLISTHAPLVWASGISKNCRLPFSRRE